MGGFGSTLGLYFEIAADPSNAKKALDDFEKSVSKTLGVSQTSFQLISGDIEQKFGLATGSIAKTGLAAQAAVKDLAYLAAGAGAVGAAVFAAAEKAAHFAEEIGHIAEKSGATTEEVSTLKFAADRAGVSSEVLDRSLGFLAKNLGNLGTGQGKVAAQALADIGVKALDANGKIRPVSVLLPQIVTGLGKLQDGGVKTADAVALFGRGGMALVPVLNEMRQGFEAVEAEARSMGLVISPEDVLAAGQFLIAQRNLTAELQGFGLMIGCEVMPWLRDMFVELEHYPLVLEHIKLRALELGAIAAAPLTFGGSLALLVPLQEKIAESNKKMDQAFTDSLVRLEQESKAALAAGISIDKHTASTKAAAQATADEASEVPKIVALYDRLWQTLDTTDASYKRYLAIISQVNKIEDENSRQILASMNEQILVRDLSEKRNKLAQDEEAWRTRSLGSIARETSEVKVLNRAWEETIARQMGIHASTLRFIQDTTQMGLRTRDLRQEFIRTYALGLPQELNISQKALLQWANDSKLQISSVEIAMTLFGEASKDALRKSSEAMANAGINALVYSQNVGQALLAALKATLASLAESAAVHAIEEVATGFAWLSAWPVPRPDLAAMAFTSAKVWGIVAGVSLAGAMAMPSPSMGGATKATSAAIPGGTAASAGTAASRTSGPPALASGAASAAAREKQQSQDNSVTVIIQGSVYGGKPGIDELTKHISDAVQHRNVNLVSRRALLPPYAAR